MGIVTPNIGIFIPAAGDTNYSDSFASGMLNIDQHDHSGGPNKGLPISSSGLADFSVTFNKLNSNVVDVTTGIGVNSTPGSQNQLQLLGILKNLFTLAGVPGVGFVSMNGETVAARTFQDTSTVTWTNADGVSGNPSADFNIAGISPVTVPNGGTGVTSFNAWNIICGGITSTDPLQQVSGEGTIGQVLMSGGAGVLPDWTTYINPGIVNFASVTLNQSQMQNLSITPIEIVATPGSGKIINPINVYALLNFGSTSFTGVVAVALTYGAATNSGILFPTNSFEASANTYYSATNVGLTSSGIGKTNAQNQALNLIATGPFGGGNGCSVTFICSYVILTL